MRPVGCHHLKSESKVCLSHNLFDDLTAYSMLSIEGLTY